MEKTCLESAASVGVQKTNTLDPMLVWHVPCALKEARHSNPHVQVSLVQNEPLFPLLRAWMQPFEDCLAQQLVFSPPCKELQSELEFLLDLINVAFLQLTILLMKNSRPGMESTCQNPPQTKQRQLPC
jgi:hypothetical protein